VGAGGGEGVTFFKSSGTISRGEGKKVKMAESEGHALDNLCDGWERQRERKWSSVRHWATAGARG